MIDPEKTGTTDSEVRRVEDEDPEHLPADAPDDNPDDLTVQGGE